jgi:hypothetical protein
MICTVMQTLPGKEGQDLQCDYVIQAWKGIPFQLLWQGLHSYELLPSPDAVYRICTQPYVTRILKRDQDQYPRVPMPSLLSN